MFRFGFFTPGADANNDLDESIEVSVDYPSCRDDPLKPRDDPLTSSTISVSRSMDSVPSIHNDLSIEQFYSESSGSEESNHDGQSIEQSYSESSDSIRSSNNDDTSILQSYTDGSDFQTLSTGSGGSEIDDMIGGFEKKTSHILMAPTAETFMETFSTSQTLSECQEDTEVEKATHSVEEAIVKQESGDGNGSAGTQHQAGGVVDEGYDVGDLKVDCVVEVSGSESISAMQSSDGSENLGTSGGFVPTGDKLAMMMRDRIQAINCIRNLLDSESIKETDTVFELSNEVKMLHHDIACKGQANNELMKTVTRLKTKNKDYTQQIRQLTLAIDEFVISKNEASQQITALEDDLSVKKTVIDEISAENCNKDKLLEEKIAQSDDLAEQLRRSKAENEELKAAIQDLVASNKEQITHITMLKDDVAVKTSMADKMSMEISEWRTKCEDKATENVAVSAQLELSKVESDVLRETIQEFETKNTKYANELENLMASLQEMVELNGELQSRVEQVSVANDELGEANKVSEEKNAELLDVVECLTNSINDERSAHEAEKDAMKKLMEAKEENHNITMRGMEETLKEVTDRMNAEMLAHKEFSDESIANLTKSLNEARVYRDDVSGENAVLKTKMEKLKKSLALSHKDLASSIGQLEKDLNEEFQITAELKTSAEELALKLNEGKDNSGCVDNAEDILGNLRMIQCWQVSHIQLMNKLLTENNDQVRSIRKE